MGYGSRLISVVLLSVFLVGCAKRDNVDPGLSPDTEVNVATFDKGVVSDEHMLAPMLMGNNLYYWKGSWDNDSKRWSDTVVCRRAGGETETVEMIALGDREMLCFTVDEGQNLYCLYAECSDGGDSLFFRKDGPDGNTVFDIPVPAEAGARILQDVEENGFLSHGMASRQGETVFRGGSGSLYLFDKKGGYLCSGSDGWDGERYQGTEKGLANAGDGGIYTYAAADGTVSLARVGMTDAGIGEVSEVSIGTGGSTAVFSGYDKGLLVWDGSSLWGYDPAGKGRELLVDLTSDSVGLGQYSLDSIGILEDGRLYVMVTRKGGQTKRLAYIEPMALSEVPVKQTIVIGSLAYDGDDSELERMAEEFNKYSTQYQVETQYYNQQDLYLELLKGEGPDGFQLFQESALASQGVLEDLTPWFAESSVVKESDLLPAVRDAVRRDGELLSVFTGFHIRGIMVKQGMLGEGVWTPEDYLALGEQYPEAKLAGYMNPIMTLEEALYADMGSFMDWQGRECTFNSKRFISILDSVKQVTGGKDALNSAEEITEWRENACQWLYDGKTMTQYFDISDILDLLEYRDAYGEFAEFRGYPNSGGAEYYRLMPDYMLAMNSASEKKEGVWAFLEFLLSEEYEDPYPSFPVREDMFEDWIEEWVVDWEKKPRSEYNSLNFEPWRQRPRMTEEDLEFLRYLMDNAYRNGNYSVAMDIIAEEAGGFWSGDKTADEVADIIQNRIQLYLDEQSLP